MKKQKRIETETPVGVPPLATGSLLSWAQRDAESLRGFLPQQPGTTLFIIEDADDEENRVHLLGAIVPDEEEMEVWHINDAKAAAEQYLRDWLLNIAEPIIGGIRRADTLASEEYLNEGPR